jgi:hypothetical protein
VTFFFTIRISDKGVGTMPREYDCRVIKLIHESEIDAAHRVQVRIVSWNGGKPTFEVRPLHLKDGEWRNGQHYIKAKSSEQLQAWIDADILGKGLEALKELENESK